MEAVDRKPKSWTFLTNHSQVLLCIARNPRMTTREISFEVGITERAVQGIVRDLEEGGYIRISKDGRRNLYELDDDKPMRHPAQEGHTVHELLEVLAHA